MTNLSFKPVVLLILAGFVLIGTECLTADENTSAPTQSVTETVQPEAKQADPTEIAPEILAPVVDPEKGIKTFGIQDRERGAYYAVLHQAHQVDVKLQKAAARRLRTQRRQQYPDPRVRDNPDAPFPVFVDLFKNADDPGVYHGKLVTLAGHVRLLREMPAGENAYGIKTLYEAWLYTEDSQNNPACIVCTSLPEGMQDAFNTSKSQVLDHVGVTGYFFKMMGYRAEDAFRYAPLILAHRLEWRPIDNSKDTEWLSKYGTAFAVAIALGVILFLRRMSRPNREPYSKRLRDEESEVSFDGVNEIDVDTRPESTSDNQTESKE